VRPPPDSDLQDLFARDVDRAWRVFLDWYTPAIVAAIERLDVRDADEAMDVYTRVCERLAERDCARLRRFDPGQGSLGAWLSTVVRNAAVDWVRSRAGRRRLFGVVAALDPFHQQVFQLFYWQERTPSEIAGELSTRREAGVTLGDVLGALDTIHAHLSDRHYAELVSMAARSRPAVSLEAELDRGAWQPVAPASSGTAADEPATDVALEAALAALPAEEAAIVRLHFLEGLSLSDVRRALHLPSLSRRRVAAVLSALRRRLSPEAPPVPAGARPAGTASDVGGRR
jgi:DNA-directed RNA polymerase specialized sigma24 family protein